MSAIVVSQSFVGAQYLKARNRIIGTILGIMASFISAYLYVGNELYFIVFSMLWISFMSVMISLVPTDNSHLFQLGANTYAFVALPLILSPEETYFNLITRSTGVFMGVVILVVTSVLMLLKRSDYDFKKNMRGIFRKTIRINKVPRPVVSTFRTLTTATPTARLIRLSRRYASPTCAWKSPCRPNR